MGRKTDVDAMRRGVTARVSAPPEAVYAVLADGWNYASWVVGASNIRHADEQWPAKGSRIRHSIGPWPLVIKDSTIVAAADPPRLLVLEARMWPFGKARVRFDIAADGEGAKIRMTELVVKGPVAALPDPVQAKLLGPRNRETLRRLARLAEAKGRS
ncbi:SRPBCC family protein [Glycomyces tritici]|uniref:SRPBCC family protein n=1 Tax=Glycomyces tritici TaxID=2665176 RepID=A0ABT7YYH7_9ACTN|nr:SRPBCC family protein [Glycomyces tritici]MDN3242094.1 SRPBCC family protein [Glycomyces tritici]MDN3243682.1 SRPBCC family protein [Glycomyces tritici]